MTFKNHKKMTKQTTIVVTGSLRVKNTSTFVCHFVLSPREWEKKEHQMRRKEEIEDKDRKKNY